MKALIFPQIIIDLTTDSIPKLLRQLFIPASVGMFFSVLYNVVDTYFGGQISPQALASLSIIFPIFFLIIAVSIGFSAGASALIATQIGAKKKEEAKRFYCQFLSFGLFLSFFLTLVGLFVSKPMLIFIPTLAGINSCLKSLGMESVVKSIT